MQERWLDRLWAAVLAETAEATPYPRGGKQALREKCAQTAAYVSKRRAYMDYATYLEKGLMIGIGMIESSPKRLIAGRLKEAGMHGSLEGANAIAHLRALRLSDGPDWERLWKRMTAA